MRWLAKIVLGVTAGGLLLPARGADVSPGSGDIQHQIDSRRQRVAEWTEDIARSQKRASALAARAKSLEEQIASKKKQLTAQREGADESEGGRTSLAGKIEATSATLAAQRRARAEAETRVASLVSTLHVQGVASRSRRRPSPVPREALVFYLAAHEAAAAEGERARLALLVQQNEESQHQLERDLAASDARQRKASTAAAKLAGEIEQIERELKQVRDDRQKYLSRAKLLTKVRATIEKQVAGLEAQQQAAAAEPRSSQQSVPPQPSSPPRSSPTPRVRTPAPLPPNIREGNGLDFTVPKGTEIHAVEAGEVLYAERFGGYGNLVILEHNDGTMSLYGFLSEISVQAGSRASRGQVVGRSGFIEASDRAGLRFEMRLMRDGRDMVINPRSWLPEGVDLQHRLLNGTD